MTFNLLTFRERVEQMLNDTGNAIWDRTWLEEAIRQAMLEYSQFNPYQRIGTVTAAAATHELDISSLTGLLTVTEVHSPYTAASPEYPPNRIAFRHWSDNNIIFSLHDQFGTGQVARVFYTTLHTLADLDGETTTTVDIRDEVLLAQGAAGHAATSRAVDLTEKVSVGQLTAQQVRAWGLSKLQEFRAGLNGISRRSALDSSSRVELPSMDRWDSNGKGWV